MNFSIIKPLSEQGGYGRVYLCADENGREYALKKLQRKDDFSLQRFQREVRLMDRLSHPNVIRLVAHDLENEDPYYVMPKYKCSLRLIIPDLYEDYQRQITIINAMLSGISYLHSEGVIHRDLKPENILYNTDNDVVITDFGLGLQLNSDSDRLTWSTVFGTPRYCSPEQLGNSHDVDLRTDIFAVGKIIEDIVSCLGFNNNYDEGIKYIVEKCTKWNREDRFGSITELSKSLASVYNVLLGLTEPRETDQRLLLLSQDTISQEELKALALQIQSSNRTEQLDQFLSVISPEKYAAFEAHDVGLAENMVKRVCAYWDQPVWPYSYIDTIANNARKIFHASKEAEIKAILLYRLINIAINYNRFYAMRVARELIYETRESTAVQTALTHLLRGNWLTLEVITPNISELPPMLLEVYEEMHEKMHV